MAETFSGQVQIQNVSNNTTILLDGQNGDAIFKNAAGEQIVKIDGSEGDIIINRKYGTANRQVFKFDASTAQLKLGCNGNEGDLRIRDSNGADSFIFDGNSGALYLGTANNEGDLRVRDSSGNDSFIVDGGSAAVYVGRNGNEGDLRIRDSAGRDVFIFDGNSAALYIGANGNEGDIQVRDGAGRTVFAFDGNYAVLRVGSAGNEGDIIVKDDNGNESIHLNGGSGDIILRNADAAEHFDVVDVAEVEPGMTMVINEEGKLKPSSTPYDKKVIGVVAGAGKYKPGIIMDQQENSENRVPVSVLGKVSCKVDASKIPIEIGDLLTTSALAGHAMKAADPCKAMGSIVGKALSPLPKGTGYVDMLVMQQ